MAASSLVGGGIHCDVVLDREDIATGACPVMSIRLFAHFGLANGATADHRRPFATTRRAGRLRLAHPVPAHEAGQGDEGQCDRKGLDVVVVSHAFS